MKVTMPVFVLSLMFLLSGCNPSAVKQSAMPPTTVLAGCYISDDGTGYNILRLRLKPDMTYKAVIWGDVGSWGSASGTWRIENNSVMFQSIMEKERMKGFAGPLLVRHGFMQGYLLDLSTSINKDDGKPGWFAWSLLMSTTCNSAYGDKALSPP